MSLFTCPICKAALNTTETPAHCPAGHSFDRARQGYLNLLPVQKKRSLAPGDSPEMVDARRAFLDQGFYTPLSNKINEIALTHLTDVSAPIILDIGCGEGYYSDRLISSLDSSAELYGFDIAKIAVQRAAARYKGHQWFVASAAEIPLQPASVDLGMLVFSRLIPEPLAEVIKPDGYLLVVYPGTEHLLQLRQEIYDDVRASSGFNPRAELVGQFTEISIQQVRFEFTLRSAEQRDQLLAMTPYGHKTKPNSSAQLDWSQARPYQADFQLALFKRNP